MTWTWEVGTDSLWTEATGTTSPRDLMLAYLDDRGQMPPPDICRALVDMYVRALDQRLPRGYDAWPGGVSVPRHAPVEDHDGAVATLRAAAASIQPGDIVAAYRRDHDDPEPT